MKRLGEAAAHPIVYQSTPPALRETVAAAA